ncbi:beta-galactosidase [Parabacteroides sp. OttesenSCG-928-K15]|nr:beta-galactosidase [Parabacteroides sp. OttesenSCG-928-K15]
MKKTFLFIAFLVISLIQSVAQYKIDLSNTETPVLKPLKLGHAGPRGKEIDVNNLYMTIGGKPVLPVMGEFHYNRMDPQYWEETLLKMKASGVNIVSTYILWILHEEFEGRQSWTGHNDLRRFVQLCQKVGLMVHLRIGPYCNAEIRNGGLPDWIAHRKEFKSRSNDPLYLKYVQYWYKSIYDQMDGLLYKDNGPVIGVQLENEYVTEGLVISHIMNLKGIAVNAGFDVPVYSMTHWMASEYPKGEVIPYAGYYIETPWINNGGKENPVSNFEFFSYGRISDNIGNDYIESDRKIESLEGEASDSPYFTCEVGLGTPNYYIRRAIVPEEMAGANINLRLGCGVNLMGYYLYAGQTDPVGEQYILSRQTARISNDYQAPIKEFGSLGTVMKEAKKLNYFMNDFGSVLAPAKAYLPVSNKDTTNLQWAVRVDQEKGFLFCSNYLYKHDRRDYRNVQFRIRLDKETLNIPRKQVRIKNGAYFFWPFNQTLGDVKLKYATLQPICKHIDGDIESYFFFEDDDIPGEFLLSLDGVKDITVSQGMKKTEKGNCFIHSLSAGKDCNIVIEKEDGKKVVFVILTEKESDHIWKGNHKGDDLVAISSSSLLFTDDSVLLMNEDNHQEVWIYQSGRFVERILQSEKESFNPEVKNIGPMSTAEWIKPLSGQIVQKQFNGKSLSDVERAYIRYYSPGNVQCTLNDKVVKATAYKEYMFADVTKAYENGMNQLLFMLDDADSGIIAEMEVLLTNGTRWLWSTDNRWTCENSKTPVTLMPNSSYTATFAPEEHLATYTIKLPDWNSKEEMRLYINLYGNIANAYIGSRLIHDVFNNGTDWIIGVNRYADLFDNNREITIRIEGLKTPNSGIYFEKGINPLNYLSPEIRKVELKKEYRANLFRSN